MMARHARSSADSGADGDGASAAGLMVLIAPNRSAWDRSADEFSSLADLLRANGVAASVQTPRDGNYSLGGVVIDELIDISVFVWETVRDDTLELIVGALLADAGHRFRRRSEAGRGGRDDEPIARIYGPNGETLRDVSLGRPRQRAVSRVLRALGRHFGRSR